MREKIKHIQKNCKWPLEISPTTGLPKEYYSYDRYKNRCKPKESWKMVEWQKSGKEPNWRAKLWSMLAMEHSDEVEAAVFAYELQDVPESRKFAMAISARNKRDERIHKFAQDVAEEHGKTILELSRTAEKESVRLAAAIDILNRLGFKAPEKIEIDDKRELTPEDNLAVATVIDILNPTAKDAEIFDDEPETKEIVSGTTDLSLVK